MQIHKFQTLFNELNVKATHFCSRSNPTEKEPEVQVTNEHISRDLNFTQALYFTVVSLSNPNAPPFKISKSITKSCNTEVTISIGKNTVGIPSGSFSVHISNPIAFNHVERKKTKTTPPPPQQQQPQPITSTIIHEELELPPPPPSVEPTLFSISQPVLQLPAISPEVKPVTRPSTPPAKPTRKLFVKYATHKDEEADDLAFSVYSLWTSYEHVTNFEEDDFNDLLMSAVITKADGKLMEFYDFDHAFSVPTVQLFEEIIKKQREDENSVLNKVIAHFNQSWCATRADLTLTTQFVNLLPAAVKDNYFTKCCSLQRFLTPTNALISDVNNFCVYCAVDLLHKNGLFSKSLKYPNTDITQKSYSSALELHLTGTISPPELLL